jgi:predicted nucleotidyltransferase
VVTDFGLKTDDLLAVTRTFPKVPHILRAAIFGSRAKGDHKPYSDVDIVLYGDLTSTDVESVIADLEDLPLVYQFDVVAYDLVKNPELRQHIERVGVSIYEKQQTK